MPINNINKFHIVLYCIREKNNHMKIQLNKWYFISRAEEFKMDGDINQYQIIYNLENASEY